MAKLRLKQLENVLTGSLNISGSLGVSGSALTIDGAGTVSGSALSSGSFGRLNSYTLDIDSIQGNWTNAGNTVADLGVVTTVDINGGTIDGSDVTVGAGKTLDVSGGTLTLANDQISGDNIEGGTIGSTTITTLDGTTIKDFDTISGSAISTGSFGVLQVPQTHGIDFLSGGGGTTHKWKIFNSSSDIFEISSIAYGGSPITIDATGGGVNVAANLDVGNGIDVTGNVITTGNVSGSATSTGSFSNIVTNTRDVYRYGVQAISDAAETNPAVDGRGGGILIENLNSAGSAMLRMRGGDGISRILYGENNSTDELKISPRNQTSNVFKMDSVGDITVPGDITLAGTGTNAGDGDIIAAGKIQAEGNISGSSTSTGSFGELHIDDRIGIGTTNPTKELHVVGDALVTGILTAQEFHTEFVSASIQFTSGSTKFGDTSDDIHSLSGSLRVTGSGVHYISDGNFGIGDIAPTSKLNVVGKTKLSLNGQTASDRILGLEGHSSQTGNAIEYFKTGGSATFIVDKDGDITTGNIDVSGNVSGSSTSTATFGNYGGNISGSSTSTGSFGLLKISDSHQGDLLIQGDSSTAQLKIRPNVNTGDSELLFSRFNRANAGYIEYGHLADVMNFYAAGPALRFSLDSSGANINQALSVGTDITAGGDISGSATSTGSFGELHIKDRVGIGTTTPSASLHVEGSILVDVYEQGGDEFTGGIFFREGYGTSQPSITVKAHNTNPDGLSLNAHDGISFRTNDTERARITQTGDFGITGSLNVTGNISGSATHTGSFGSVETAGNINSSGRIFEQNTSVIDHATAMAIVFGG